MVKKTYTDAYKWAVNRCSWYEFSIYYRLEWIRESCKIQFVNSIEMWVTACSKNVDENSFFCSIWNGLSCAQLEKINQALSLNHRQNVNSPAAYKLSASWLTRPLSTVILSSLFPWNNSLSDQIYYWSNYFYWNLH